MNRSILAAFLLGAVCSSAAGADGEDPVKVRLNRAKADFEADHSKAKADIVAQLDQKLEAAQKAGDLAALKKLRAEREDFLDRGDLPRSVPTTAYFATGKKTAERMALAFGQARKEYTQAGKIDEADSIDKELDAFLKSGGSRVAANLPKATPSQTNAFGNAKVRFISAEYGVDGKNINVTERIVELLAQEKSIMVDVTLFQSDPAVHVSKSLKLKLQIGDQTLELTIPDGGKLKLSSK